MNLRYKVKRLAITIAVTLGVFTGLFVFIATYNSLQDTRFQIILSLLAGLFYAGVAFGGVIGVYKILGWVLDGFGLDEEEISGVSGINIRVGCRRTAVVLAGITAICCSVLISSILLSEYYAAKNDQLIFESQNQGKDYKGKAYYDYAQRFRLEDNYWLNLHKGQLVGICVSAGLAGAAAGFCVVWFVYKFLERLILNIWLGKGRR
ncbi:MAG: hypothetical protein ACYS0C_06845 [Planctomycetota bacterium]|jgi:hypothetical protein